jgi:hypothetical protein
MSPFVSNRREGNQSAFERLALILLRETAIRENIFPLFAHPGANKESNAFIFVMLNWGMEIVLTNVFVKKETWNRQKLSPDRGGS